MYKHQVIGVRREVSFRSRKSNHIVGVCTLEALDAEGRFHDFGRRERWQAEDGKVSGDGADGLRPRCRYWALEEVVRALKTRPRGRRIHEFYTRHPKTRHEAKLRTMTNDSGTWITTYGRGPRLTDLSAPPERIACDVREECPLIADASKPVHRAHGADS